MEKKGISRLFDKWFDLKNEYFTGSYESDIQENYESYIEEIDGNYYRFLTGVVIYNYHEVYDEYKRRKIIILDVLSTISALFSPIKLVFLFIYEYYSNNFNNYKIMEKILNPIYKNKNIIELKNMSEIRDLSKKDLNDNEKQNILLKSDFRKKSDNIEELINIEDDYKSLNIKDRILPKYPFL